MTFVNTSKNLREVSKMANELARDWWALAIKGGLAVLFGIAAIVWPDITFKVLLGLFGVFMLADGIFSFVGAVQASHHEGRWWTYLVEGLVEVGIGILVFTVPGVTALVLLYFIAFWAIFMGIWRIATAIELRREIAGEWLMAATGVISLLFGFAVLAFPGAGALALVILIGIFALAFGVLSVVLAFSLRSWEKQQPQETRKAA